MRNYSPALIILFILLFAAVGFSQTVTPAPTPLPLPPEDTDVVKITTTLIQIDATVTDKKGNTVQGLKPEDFEVYENGKKQNITNFSFIGIGPENQPAQTGGSSSKSTDKSLIPLPSFKLRPEQVRRTYAVIVDDLGLSFASSAGVKDALKKFVNEQMQEGDLVAILRVGGGLGALQSFTSDKRQLLAAISKIRWNSSGRVGINSYDAVKPTPFEEFAKLKGKNTQSPEIEKDKAMIQEIEGDRQDNIATGTFGALRAIITGMSELPGRKSIMLFSEGFEMNTYSGGMAQTNRIIEQMRSITESATRASIVFYTFDPRGIYVPMKEAQDETYEGQSSVPFNLREMMMRDTKDSLKYLSDGTGGLAYVNQNNISAGMQMALNDQGGYYLLGYQPDEETFDAKKNKFNNLEVRIKRPDLKIRYRSGFFGVTDEKKKLATQTPAQQFNAALLSPFGATGINLDLYSIFFNNAKNGNFINSFVRINAKDLNFTQEADGKHKAVLDMVAMTFGENGAPVDRVVKNFTLLFGEKEYQKALEKDFIYTLAIPVKKTGAYQFRIAMRDEGSGKIGSASQFVEVPNISKKNLTLSNIIVKNYSLANWKKISSDGRNGNNDSPDNNVFLDTTSRQFKRGTVMNYLYVIYNAKTDSTQNPQLQVQTRLFRNGEMILQSAPTPLTAAGQQDLQRIEISDAITIGTDLQTGDYVLQLVVFDALAKGKRQIATQSIDFEIVK